VKTSQRDKAHTVYRISTETVEAVRTAEVDIGAILRRNDDEAALEPPTRALWTPQAGRLPKLIRQRMNHQAVAVDLLTERPGE
jgi:hypothetical protein